MDYSGYNGTITVEDDVLTVTHSGFVAKAGGLAPDQPRNIPLAAISGVSLKPATRMVNGWITLGVGGAPVATLSGGTAGSDANTVMFRYKDLDTFTQLRDWLLTVIEHNRASGIDPSTVAVDAAAPTRLEKNQAVQSEKVAQTQAAQEQKMTQMLGEERPDIVAAAAQMNWRFGGKRELKRLADQLHEGETVRRIAQGTYDRKQGILALTDIRLIFLYEGVVSQNKEDFPLRSISSVQTKKGFASGDLKIFVSGNSAVISGVVNKDLDALADDLRAGMARQHAPAPAEAQPVAAQPATDPFEAMQKLAQLRDAGILSEEEYEAKRKEMLDRI